MGSLGDTYLLFKKYNATVLGYMAPSKYAIFYKKISIHFRFTST